MSVKVVTLRYEDREAWEGLARGYKDFYATPTTDAEYSAAWERLLAQDGVHGLGGFVEGKLVGIAHYLFHASVWAKSNCYLQDLHLAKRPRSWCCAFAHRGGRSAGEAPGRRPLLLAHAGAQRRCTRPVRQGG